MPDKYLLKQVVIAVNLPGQHEPFSEEIGDALAPALQGALEALEEDLGEWTPVSHSLTVIGSSAVVTFLLRHP
jgi:hypothetical protein